jgi:hypothetical protein
MPKSTFVELAPAEHRQILAARRRARDGSLLALPSLLWCAAGRAPTDTAVVLFCSRSSVYRTVRASRQGTLGWEHDAHGRLLPPLRTTVLVPTRRRSLVSLLKATPPGVWVVPYAWEVGHAGPDAAGQAGSRGVGRGHAALAPQEWLGVEAGETGRQGR